MDKVGVLVAYFDPFCGLSGEMILGALVDVGAPLAALRADLAKLPLPNRPLQVAKTMREGVVGTYLEIGGSPAFADGVAQIPGRLGRGRNTLVSGRELDPTTMMQLIATSTLSSQVKHGSIAIIRKLVDIEEGAGPSTRRRIAEAWNLYSLLEIVGTVSALCLLGVQHVECAPVGAWCTEDNATRTDRSSIELLRGVPNAFDESKAEKARVTPVGAAIMTTIAAAFGRIPTMRIDSLGYGASSLSNPHPGILRVILGEANTAIAADRITEPLSPAHLPHTPVVPIPDPHRPWRTTPFNTHQQSGRHVRV